MNLKPRILLIAGLLVTGATVDAQGPPVNSPDYHAIHNAQSPYYRGPKPAEQPASAQPTGYWQKTWGAIAPSPKGGVLGTAVGASSKWDAERLALEDCKSKGGGACKVLASYFNQCGAMALGAERIFTASAGSEVAAGNEAVRYCRESEGAGVACRVYYSACSEPIFHEY